MSNPRRVTADLESQHITAYCIFEKKITHKVIVSYFIDLKTMGMFCGDCGGPITARAIRDE